MARLETLSRGVQQDIASQIASRLETVTGDLAPPGAVTGLGESLKVVFLSPEAIIHGHGSLSERVERTNQWHHQVYVGETAVRFARSTTESNLLDEPHKVVEVARSALPHAIQETIRWIDANVTEDGLGELLVAPAYFLTAVWVHGPSVDLVVVAARADRLREMPLNTRIEADDFVRQLALSGPLEGLGAQRPRRGLDMSI